MSEIKINEMIKITQKGILINKSLTGRKRENVICAWNIAKTFRLSGCDGIDYVKGDELFGEYKPHNCYICNKSMKHWTNFKNGDGNLIRIGEKCSNRIIHFQFLIKNKKE